MRICDNMLIVCTYEELGNMYRRVMKENNQIIALEVMDNRYGQDMENVLAHIDSFRNKGEGVSYNHVGEIPLSSSTISNISKVQVFSFIIQ
mgnify:CR=1 FL=1